MADINAYIEINKVATEMVFKMGVNSGLRKRFLQFAIDGYRELGLYSTNMVETVKLIPDPDTGIVPFPDDLVELIDLAIPVVGGMWSITYRRTIIPTTTLIDGEEALDPDVGEGEDLFPLSYNAGGRNATYYTVDHRKRRAIVRHFSSPVLYMTYVPTGVSADSKTQIPVKYKSALQAYIRWQYYLNDINMPDNRMNTHERVWNQERHKVEMQDFVNVRAIYNSIRRKQTRYEQ